MNELLDENPDKPKHRIFYKQPKKVPPFDTAFVRSSDKEGLKVLLSAAPEHCQIILFTSGAGVAYAMKRLFKRNFRINSEAVQLDLPTLELTGTVVYQFVRGDAVYEPFARYFCAGESCLHELAQTYRLGQLDTDTIDMFCCGLKFHKALASRARGRSLVFTEEQ